MTERPHPSCSCAIFMSLHPEAAPVPRSDSEPHQRLGQTRLHLRPGSVLVLLPVRSVLSAVPPHHPRPLLSVRVSRRLEEPPQLPQVHTLEDVGGAGLTVPALGARRAGKRGLGRACENRSCGHVLHLWNKR